VSSTGGRSYILKMSGEDEYESLPEGTSMWVTLGAGALAGTGEHCVMYPVDCVKTRMQALACEQGRFTSSSILRNLVHIVREEGVIRLVSGVQTMGLAAGPAHALYFACYEQLKHDLTPVASNYGLHETVVHGVAGATATLFHDAVMTPAEVVKQRMQMCCSPYKGALNCARTVYKQEGLRAFYRSYPTALSMNIPFQATHFMVYEFAQKLTNPNRQYNPAAHAVSGAAAGAVAAFVTMPLDVCKTLLNTQEANVLVRLNTAKVVGLWPALRTVWRLAGPLGLFKGCRARVFYQMPATAISWSVYEFCKHYLSGGGKDEGVEDTLGDLRASRGSEGDSDSGRFNWDSIVTDRGGSVLRASELVNHQGVQSDLVHSFSDLRTFPPASVTSFRTTRTTD